MTSPLGWLWARITALARYSRHDSASFRMWISAAFTVPRLNSRQVIGRLLESNSSGSVIHRLGFRRLVDHVPAAYGGDETQKRHGALTDAADVLELRRRGLQHSAEGAELLHQHVGQFVGILPGLCEKQQQLQHIHIVKVLQSVVQEALFHPLPVSVVDPHCFSLVFLYR